MLQDWTNRESNGWGALLNGIGAIVALLFRNPGGYIAASSLILVGIALILDGRRRRRNARLAAESTSDGIKWTKLSSGLTDATVKRTMNGVVMDTRKIKRHVTIGKLTPDGSGVLLPQPLTLKLRCSQRLLEASADFYSNSKDLNSLKKKVEVEVLCAGKEVTIILRDEKLIGSAALSVKLVALAKEEVNVRSVARVPSDVI